jgi:hypothetical protein
LLFTSFVSKMFDVVGVDPPIRVSFTSGVVVVFSDIVATFELFQYNCIRWHTNLCI